VSPPAKSRILIVDDDEGLLVLMAETLRAEGHEVITADSGRSALQHFGKKQPDLMLLDLKMRHLDAPALLEQLPSSAASVPFIIVTGQGDEKMAVEFMKRGALDYVMKNTALLDLLPGVVQRSLAATAQKKALGEARAKSERLEAEIIQMSEREKRRIGSDLHDGLGQQLTAIELMCAGLRSDLAVRAPDLEKSLDRIGGMLREAVSQTRLLARGLVPLGQNPDALQIALAELVERTNGLGRLHCRFECPNQVLVPNPEVSGHLYRIAQEALNNALKHSKARRVTIRLAEKQGRLHLGISDDGVGFSLEDRREKGLGLGVMEHRAYLIGAELSVKSRRGGGVAIECVLPAES
jgi:signal transduction histidine kinase